MFIDKKIILSPLIILSFLAILILPSFFNMCIPDGCTFSPNVCRDGACINETIGQHLGEKSQLFSAIINFQTFVILIVFIVLFFIAKKYVENKKKCFVKFYTK